eukprot:TRINITY_DN3919_c0_g1_i5.p1 TRINITY_DN3919_c0_g1~~TRINITY_DN3919_c0_g1_i5.p1  ORF type:complete len:552 (-),score=155.81 TRINITY_DN3919_c0_g1_i5:1270-2925(-)
MVSGNPWALRTCQADHVAYLKEAEKQCAQPVPVPSDVREKVLLNFRLKYVKDHLLLSSLDDTAFQTFSSVISYNNLEILTTLQHDPDFMKTLFERLGKETDVSLIESLARLLRETCELSRVLGPDPSRVIFYAELQQHGVLPVITKLFQYVDNHNIMLSATDVLHNMLQFAPKETRSFMLHTDSEKDKKRSLLRAVVVAMLGSREPGVREQLCDIIKGVIDTELESLAKWDKRDDLLDMLYEKHMVMLTKPLGEPADNEHSAALQNAIVDILTFCVEKHSYRIKYYVLGNNILRKTMGLLQSPFRYVSLGVVRFLRAIVKKRDEFYIRHMDQYEILEPLLRTFKENGNRYNMLNSAIIDFFNVLLLQNDHILIKATVEKHWDYVKDVSYVNVFDAIKNKYEKRKEFQEQSGRIPTDTADQVGTDVEDHVFDEEEDDEEEANTRSNADDGSRLGEGLRPIRSVDEDEDTDKVVGVRITPKHKRKAVGIKIQIGGDAVAAHSAKSSTSSSSSSSSGTHAGSNGLAGKKRRRDEDDTGEDADRSKRVKSTEAAE